MTSHQCRRFYRNLIDGRNETAPVHKKIFASAAPISKRFEMFDFIFSAIVITTGAALIVWAGASDFAWNVERTFFNGRFCLPLAAGLALIISGAFFNTSWKNFGGWTALALFGQAVSLQLIDAGRFTHFQHYRSASDFAGEDFALASLIALQTLIAARGVRSRLPFLKQWLSAVFNIRQLIVIGFCLTMASAALAKDTGAYFSSLLISSFVQGVNLINIILIAWSVPEKPLKRLGKYLRVFFPAPKSNRRPRLLARDRFIRFAVVWVVSLAALLNYFVYEAHPHIADESQYFFQAGYMAAGQLTTQAPKVPEAFSIYMIPYKEPFWFGVFPPGFPAVLALGMKLNVAWLVNPLLSGLCVLLAFVFFRQIYSVEFARTAVFLLCFSPWFVFMGMSFMSHTLTLVCALSAAILFLRAFSSQKAGYAFASGLAVGALSLVRPLDGLIVAFLLGIWTLIKFPQWRSKLINAASLVAGTALAASLILPYNKAVTGSMKILPLVFYYNEYFWENSMAMGFGTDRGFHWSEDALPGHSPLEAAVNAAMNVFSINVEMLGWGIGSLFLAVFAVVSGGLRKKDGWAPVSLFALLIGYSFFWFNGGPDLGARYWFLMIIPLIALTVRGIERLIRTIEPAAFGRQIHARVVLTVITLCVLALFNYFTWRSFDKYHNYLEMRPDLPRLAQKHRFGKSLVLIRGEFEQADYRSGWIYNPVNFEGDVPLYAWDKSPEIRRELMAAYPEREVWVVEGPTLSKGAYRIVCGPVSAAALLAKDK